MSQLSAQRRAAIDLMWAMSWVLLGFVSFYPSRAAAVCPAVHGDVTGDAQVTITDVQCLILAAINALSSPGLMPSCVAVAPWEVDLDCSTDITVTDVIMGVNRALTMPLSPTLDANGDNCPDTCQPFCGDGICEAGEGCGSCPAECGCDDGIACTLDECDGTECIHSPVASACDDLDPCTSDGCDPAVGCTHGPTTDFCGCPTLPPCSGPGCGIDGDSDGILDPCDLCPQDSPNDANNDGVCDSGAVCPCGYTGFPGCNALGVTVIDPNYKVSLLTGCLPKGTVDITYGLDGNVYGIRDGAPGNEQLFKVTMATGKVNIVGTIAFTNPTTSDLWTLDQAPGGAFTNKLYLTDWISGSPARVDRFNYDLSAPEVIYSTTSGSPIHTVTSNVAFPSNAAFGNYVFFAGQGSGTTQIVRDSPTVGVQSQVWYLTNLAAIKDIRALAFGPGGVWGTDLYFAASSVLNGFDNAPGGIYKISSNLSVTTVVPESAGLEFGTNLVFDTNGILGGDLYFTQVDGKLFRISPAGTFKLIASGIQRSEPVQAADGSFLVSAQRGLFRFSCPPGVCQTVCGDGICGIGETCASCVSDCVCNDGDPCTTDTCSPSGTCSASELCPNSNPCVTSTCQSGVGCLVTPNTGTPCDDGTPCTLTDLCSESGDCVGLPACNDGSACTTDSCMEVPVCPGDATLFGSLCYAVDKINLAFASWQSAQTLCNNKGGQLVTIRNAAENAFVRQIANQKCTPVGDRVWIGLVDELGTGQWAWASGEPITYMNWDSGSGEPNLIGQQKWADMTDTALWRSSEASLQGSTACVVCEIPKTLPLLCTYTPVSDPLSVTKPETCNGADDDCDGVVDNDVLPQCNDNNPCSEDLCHGIVGCVNLFGDHVCDDGVACTIDSCTPETGCQHEPSVAVCDDGIECTEDSCHLTEGCVYLPIPSLCDDGQVCSTDTCDPQSGCVYETEGTCDDGIACTDDVCVVGAGCQFSPDSALCDDGQPCTDDVCLEGIGCQNTPNTAPCDDANACTANDVCESGVCKSGVPVVCDDGLACTVDDCQPTSGCPSPTSPTFISDCSAPGPLGGYFEGPFNAWGSTNLAFLPDPDWTCKGTLSVTIDLSREPDLLGVGTAYCSSHTTVLFVDYDYEYVLPVKVTGNVVGTTVNATVKVDQITLPWTPTIVLDSQGVPVQLVGQNSGTVSTQSILDTVGSTLPANPSSPYTINCTANRVDIEGECCNGYGCQQTQDYECYGKGGDFIATNAGQCCTDGADGNPVCVKLTDPECKVNGGYFVPATLGTCCHAPDFCANCTSDGCETCNWEPCMAISSVLCEYLGGQFSQGYTCQDSNNDGFADICGPPIGYGYSAPSNCDLVGDTLTVDIGGVADLTLVANWSQTADGYQSSGEVTVVTPFGPVDFPGAVSFNVTCVGTFSIIGTTSLPPELAGVGAFSSAAFGVGTTTQTPVFSVGFAFGYELLTLGFQGPISPSRPYLYVLADTGLDFSLDNGEGESGIVFKAVEGNSFSLAIDVEEPAFSVELEGDLLGGATGQLVKGVGFGISMGGNFQVEAKKPIWDGTNYVPRVEVGHVWRSGEFALIPIPNLPVNLYLEGEVLVNVGESLDKIADVAQALAAFTSGSVDGELGEAVDPVGFGETILGMEVLANANQVHIEILDAFEFTIGSASFLVEDGGLSFVGEGFTPGVVLAQGDAGPLFESFAALTLQQTYEVKGWVDGSGFEVEVVCDLIAGPFQLTGVRLILSSEDGIRIEGGSFGLDFGAFLKTLTQLFTCNFSADGAQCSLGNIPVINFQGGLSGSGFYLNGQMGLPVFGNLGLSAQVASDGKFQLTGTAQTGLPGLQSFSAAVTVKPNGFALSSSVTQFGAKFGVSGSMDTSGNYLLTGSANMYVGGFPYSSVAVTIDSKKGMILSGSLGISYVGNQIKMTGTIPFGGGAWTLYGVQSITLLGFSMANTEFWATSSGGVTAKGKFSFGGVSTTIAGWFSAGQGFELKGAANLSPGGFKLADAELSVTNQGAALSGKLSILGQSFAAQGQIQSNGDFVLKAYGSVNLWIGKLVLGEKYSVTFPPTWNIPPIEVDQPILFQKKGANVTVGGSAYLYVSGLGTVSGNFSAYSNGSFSCSLTTYKSVDIEVTIGWGPASYDMEIGSIGGDVTVSVWNFGASLNFAAKACAYSVCSPKISVSLGTNGEFCFPVPVKGNMCFDLW
ncbi:MAG: hypothetical protein HUU55_08860 [Myxococcales bacterium]|nr:hypothetical protein [Myxococcales bacterium]